jgi:endonuclease/exonuclease/phosphatase family metal-dependent hydrolase
MTGTQAKTDPAGAGASDAARRSSSGRTRREIIAIIVIALGIVVWSGARRTPTPPMTGARLDGQVQPSATTGRTTLRVGTFNIHSGWGLDGKQDLARTAGVVRGCDLVALQEVRGRSTFGGPTQAKVLGEQLGVSWLFAPSERQRWHDSFGNAVLSAVPVTHWQRLPISSPDSSGCRTVLLVKVPLGGTIVNVLMTHLDRGTDREAQLTMVSEMFQALSPPAILLGDLNTREDDPQIVRLKQVPGVIDALERPGVAKRGHIDWIFVKGLQCVDAGMRDDGASDHPFFWADLELVGK